MRKYGGLYGCMGTVVDSTHSGYGMFSSVVCFIMAETTDFAAVSAISLPHIPVWAGTLLIFVVSPACPLVSMACAIILRTCCIRNGTSTSTTRVLLYYEGNLRWASPRLRMVRWYVPSAYYTRTYGTYACTSGRVLQHYVLRTTKYSYTNYEQAGRYIHHRHPCTWYEYLQ